VIKRNVYVARPYAPLTDSRTRRLAIRQNLRRLFILTAVLVAPGFLRADDFADRVSDDLAFVYYVHYDPGRLNPAYDSLKVMLNPDSGQFNYGPLAASGVFAERFFRMVQWQKDGILIRSRTSPYLWVWLAIHGQPSDSALRDLGIADSLLAGRPVTALFPLVLLPELVALPDVDSIRAAKLPPASTPSRDTTVLKDSSSDTP
jgi:hypothetical protein